MPEYSQNSNPNISISGFGILSPPVINVPNLLNAVVAVIVDGAIDCLLKKQQCRKVWFNNSRQQSTIYFT